MPGDAGNGVVNVNDRKTILSPCRRYRYALWREWDLANRDYVMFIGLNPSTADEYNDDNTLKRCIDFGKRWGYGALCMTNLFAFRATKPARMRVAKEPVGAENEQWLLRCAQDASMIVAAWGGHGGFRNRDREVMRLLKGKDLYCLGTTRIGHPRHPLFLLAETKPVVFQRRS